MSQSMVPPEVAEALERVRAGADAMPKAQLATVLGQELGADWEGRFAAFDWGPMAAASIGQVHRARLPDGTPVVLKIQYPGVAESIESDIENLVQLIEVTGMLPKELYIKNAVEVAKKELALECDYTYEAGAQARFRDLLRGEEADYYVPEVFSAHSGPRILCTEFVEGVPIDQVAGMDQAVRNRVAELIFRLTIKELFEWRFMQTDPNWGNFLYDAGAGRLNLIDFGAAKAFPKAFVDEYIKMVKACADRDRDTVLAASTAMGFLTGDESPVMLDAHCEAAFTVGIPFATAGGHDFGRGSEVTGKVGNLGGTILKHRLTPPPDEAYALHRKLAGGFLACIKLRAVVPVREIFEEVYDEYAFGEEGGGDEEARAVA